MLHLDLDLEEEKEAPVILVNPENLLVGQMGSCQNSMLQRFCEGEVVWCPSR